jgi:hypothetical protein
MDLGEPGRGAAVYEQHLFYCKEKIKLAALKKKKTIESDASQPCIDRQTKKKSPARSKSRNVQPPTDCHGQPEHSLHTAQ